jgi:outer membrane protein TolC
MGTFPEPDTPSTYILSRPLTPTSGPALEAENTRLRAELAQVREELKTAAADLNTAEAELEQAIRLYPTPDEVVVLREDLRAVLDGMPVTTTCIMDAAGRLAAAVGVE